MAQIGCFAMGKAPPRAMGEAPPGTAIAHLSYKLSKIEFAYCI
jgi:hypothetical protein